MLLFTQAMSTKIIPFFHRATLLFFSVFFIFLPSFLFFSLIFQDLEFLLSILYCSKSLTQMISSAVRFSVFKGYCLLLFTQDNGRISPLTTNCCAQCINIDCVLY